MLTYATAIRHLIRSCPWYPLLWDGRRRLRSAVRWVTGEQRVSWARVVMNRETHALVSRLGPERLKALEISGRAWGSRVRFQEYRSTAYPDYDVCAGPLPETFDLIIAEQVFEHLLWPYRAGKHVYQMLNPGGHALITTPFLIRFHGGAVDCSRWTELGLKYLLAECGFPLERIHTGSWGNRACVKANLNRAFRWKRYRPRWHSLRHERLFPVSVWALAQKAPGDRPAG
jgi:SAM-dependent methyltransferase